MLVHYHMGLEDYMVSRELCNAKVRALEQAAKLAESQISPLAVEHWNAACRRIHSLIEGEIRKVQTLAETEQGRADVREAA